MWRAVHAGPEDAADLEDQVGRFGAAALQQLTSAEARYTRYDPHWVWHAPARLTRVESGDISEPPDVLVRLCLALSELYLVDDDYDQFLRRYTSLRDREWGVLGIVPGLLAARFSLDGPELTSEQIAYVRRQDLRPWVENERDFVGRLP